MATLTETKVMAKLEEMLESIPEAARDRVLTWANAKWGKRIDEFATTLLPSVERVSDGPTEPLPRVETSVTWKDPRRG